MIQALLSQNFPLNDVVNARDGVQADINELLTFRRYKYGSENIGANMLTDDKKANDETTPEYSVYTYRESDRNAPDAELDTVDWERKITTRNKTRAIAQAKKLYASNDYHRVEVKKKELTSASSVPLDSIFKIYQKKKSTLKTRGLIMAGAVSLIGLVMTAIYKIFAL